MDPVTQFQLKQLDEQGVTIGDVITAAKYKFNSEYAKKPTPPKQSNPAKFGYVPETSVPIRDTAVWPFQKEP